MLYSEISFVYWDVYFLVWRVLIIDGWSLAESRPYSNCPGLRMNRMSIWKEGTLSLVDFDSQCWASNAQEERKLCVCTYYLLYCFSSNVLSLHEYHLTQCNTPIYHTRWYISFRIWCSGLGMLFTVAIGPSRIISPVTSTACNFQTHDCALNAGCDANGANASANLTCSLIQRCGHGAVRNLFKTGSHSADRSYHATHLTPGRWCRRSHVSFSKWLVRTIDKYILKISFP